MTVSEGQSDVEFSRSGAIQGPERSSRMRHALTDTEWRLIEPILPCKPRGVPRVDGRRARNGIFWTLRSGTPWRDLPEPYGPCTTCYDRFVRWRMALIPEQGDAIQAGRRGVKQASLPDI